MSLWGRGLGVLALLVLLVIGCEEETSFLGFRKGNKFQVRYIELDISSSVMLTDSLASYNSPDVPDDKRILIGQYTDDFFGTIKATAFTQFGPYISGPIVPIDAEVDSLILTLTFDHYHYGSTTPNLSFFKVHELIDTLNSTDTYFTESTPAYNATPLGTGFYSINPAEFDLKRNNLTDTLGIDTVQISLDKTYANGLLQFAKLGTGDFGDFLTFREIYRGFAIVPGASDERIVGFNPLNDRRSTYSRLTLYYKYENIDGIMLRDKLEFSIYSLDDFTSVVGFTNFSANRSGTSLAPINSTYQEFIPPNDLRYVQAGNPVVTKLDFSDFLSFTDTVSNLVLNSAEISIEGLEPSDHLPSATMRLRVLNPNNKFRKLNEGLPADYNRIVGIDEEGLFTVVGDEESAMQIKLVETGGVKKYSGYMTEYLQKLIEIRDIGLIYKDFGLIAFTPEFGKSVNRAVFNKENIKLKIYYTVPLTVTE